MSKKKWVAVKGVTGIKQNTSDGRYQIRTAVRVGDEQRPQMIVLEPGYSLDEAVAIKEMMKDALREGEKFDKDSIEPPGFQKVVRLQHGASDDDFEELHAELAAAEARIEELEEQVAAALAGESEAVSAADWMRRAREAEERLEEASNFEKQALDHKARADVAEKKLAKLQTEMDEVGRACAGIEKCLHEACEEWGIEDLEEVGNLEALTRKVCAEYTNLYNEQTVALHACEEELREQKMLPESLALELKNACERWGFEEPGEDVSLATVERALVDYDALCKQLDQVKPSTLEVVRGLEAECIVLREWQAEACRLLTGKMHDQPIQPENFHASLGELCLYTDALDAGQKKHNKKVAMLAEDRDRRREEAKEALEAKARLEAELSEARRAIEGLGTVKDLLLSACVQILGQDRLGGMLTLTPEQLAGKIEAAVLEDREIDVLEVEGEEDRERLVREHAIMFEALEQVMMHHPLDVLDLTGTDKQRAGELAYQVRSEVLLQNTRDDNNPNLDGMLLFSLESARELPHELSRRVEQLEAEVLDVRQEKEALEAEVEELLAQARLMPERERYLLMLIRDGWFVLMALEEQNPESFARTMDARAHRFLRLGAREVSQRDPNHVVAHVGEVKAG